jgi:hypothetical protein
MADFFQSLFDGTAPVSGATLISTIAVSIGVAIFARRVKTPKRPDPDPLADTEFDENGAVKKKDA